MTADLVITEDMIFNMARKYEEFADSSRSIHQNYPYLLMPALPLTSSSTY